MLLTTTQVAERLGVTRQRVGQLIAHGLLTATKVGHAWVVEERDLAAFEPRKVGRPRKAEALGGLGLLGDPKEK